MTERLKSVYRATYVDAADVPEREFDRVFGMLELTAADEEPIARRALKNILDEFHARRRAVEFAAPKEADVRALTELLSRARKARESGDWNGVAQFVRELGGSNPVLRQRLTHAFGKGGLGDPRVFERLSGSEEVIEGLLREVEGETRSGRRYDGAGYWFANRIFEYWIRFTKQGTSRVNWSVATDGGPNEGGPFPDFLREAGKAVDPDFNGHHYARQVHEEAKDSLDARRLEAGRRWPRNPAT